jgi:hypothetical protein
MGRSMVGTTTDSAEIVGDAFSGLTRHVGHELASLVTRSKIELSDLLSFVDSTVTQILGRLIESGLNVGLSALFAPSSSALQPAFTTSGGTPVHTLHSGGVVGRDGVRRLVDPAVFIGAARMHAGGMVGLRPGEVPIIARHGETVLPPGVAAGGNMVVNVINQSSANIERSAERRRPDGGRELDLVIRDQVSRQIARGDHDRALAARFGTHADVVETLDGIHARAEAIGDAHPEHTELRDAILELLALHRRSLLGEDGTAGKPGGIIGGEDWSAPA